MEEKNDLYTKDIKVEVGRFPNMFILIDKALEKINTEMTRRKSADNYICII